MNLNDTIERAREVMRFQHKSWKTEKSYVGWIGRFARWCQRHPVGDHAAKVRGFLTSIAADRGCAASTQSQALNALVFLYRHVLNEEVA